MKKLFQLSIMATFLVFAACSPEDEDPDPTPDCNNPEVVIVDASFNLDQPVTLESCKVYYFVENVTFKSTVTIEAGAILKFKDLYTWSGLSLTNNATGKIIALGTAEKPIIFTSDKDDAHGGDNNGDGSGSSPAPGDWDGIYLVGNGSIFEHCKFLYGGQSENSPLIDLYNVDTRFDHCTFAYSRGSAAISGKAAVHFGPSSGQAKVTNSIFYMNTKPLSIHSNISMDGSNIFHNPDNPSQKNTYNGIFVNESSDQGNITWEEDEVPFVYYAYYATQSLGTNFDPWTFTLAPGVIIKFATSGPNAPGIWVRSDNSVIVNRDAPGVYFTSYKDDAHGGDTNGDGNASAPSSGDWDGIYDVAGIINPPDNYYNWGNILYAAN